MKVRERSLRGLELTMRILDILSLVRLPTVADLSPCDGLSTVVVFTSLDVCCQVTIVRDAN